MPQKAPKVTYINNDNGMQINFIVFIPLLLLSFIRLFKYKKLLKGECNNDFKIPQNEKTNWNYAGCCYNGS